MKRQLWIGLIAVVCVAAIAVGALLMDDRSSRIAFSTKERTRISFSWWGNDGRNVYTLRGVRRYESENPGIDLDCRFSAWNGYALKEQMAMNSRTNADVMQINYAWLAQYSAGGDGYYDLNRLGKQIDLDNYSPEDLAYGTRGGKLNAVPIAYNVDTAMYNRDIFDSFGLDLPATWEDLFADARVMSKEGIYPMSAVLKHTWLMLIAWYEQTYGHPAFSQDGTCHMQTEEVTGMLEFYRRLLDERVLPPLDEADSDFLNGTAAGILCWISDTDRYGNVLKEEGADIVPAALPTNGSANTGWYMKPATLYAISSTTRHPKEAARFLQYLVADREMVLLQGTEKGIPINQKAYGILEEEDRLSGITQESQQVFESERESLSPMPNILEDEDLIDAFKSAAGKYYYGKASAGDCAREILDAAARAESEGAQ